ncbi:RAQPRD family integrative conjugative element protein [Xenorhabdus bovienii]|uniref:integrative conjugative element protein, RAQPRD family n=1 Tax=Xenorhabdus bovienii TaxID=40576 RepID=UPI00237CD3FC|nr:RAQPRD family integrative conjugative element protein [Xenorhabdus bovienii]MDE1486561.1 RAQPRD family integrative conjugative element protein [Xenorhabdus bovienii]MDE1496053.1 RAQPRD family integrative conjugative element protein [Xenorhabdus bovienii]MDE9446601.1 RAQPRD family integrative conjugative element protein [Xenorhabdus bovienii]MDE9474081.1 RAQPRD family integrative conjugative element protein [Xenorhabdus bovienii]MDE9477181.1 RAQPRD family integrative conjugative element prot
MRCCFSLSRSACLLSLILVCVPLAQAAEKDELASAKNLIDQVQMALERANLAEKQADIPTRPRYDFDYLRIRADLNTIKAGIDHYLTPSRAQQQESNVLSGHYRQERP